MALALLRSVLDLVEDNIDFAFRAGDLHTDHAVARLVLSAKTKCVAHPHLLAQYGTPTTPDDLVRFPCVGFAKAEQKELIISLENKVLKLPYVFASNDVYAVAYFIRQGRGIGYLPEQMANRLIKEYGLVEVLHDYPMRTYPVHLLYLKHRYPSSVMRAFLDFVMEKVGFLAV